MKVFGTFKVRDPGCIARFTAQRSACERDQARAIDDCKQKRYAEIANCLVLRERSKASCESSVRAEAQRCRSKMEREIRQAQQMVETVSVALKQARAVRMIQLPPSLISELGMVFPNGFLNSVRVVQTYDFTSLVSIFVSGSRYLDELAVRDIPYPGLDRLSGAGAFLFIPDGNKSVSLRDITQVVALLELYSKLGTDGLTQVYILERHVLESYIAERVDGACRKLKCDEVRSLA